MIQVQPRRVPPGDESKGNRSYAWEGGRATGRRALHLFISKSLIVTHHLDIPTLTYCPQTWDAQDGLYFNPRHRTVRETHANKAAYAHLGPLLVHILSFSVELLSLCRPRTGGGHSAGVNLWF